MYILIKNLKRGINQTMATFDQFTKVLALYEDGPDDTKKLFNLGFNASGDCDCFVQSASGDPTSSTEGTINFGGDLTCMFAYNGAQDKTQNSVGDSFNVAKTERTAESDRAIAKEALIDSDLATEQSARISGDGTLQSNLDAEEARAISSEGTLTTNLANEVFNRASADTAHDNALASEASTARSAETVNMNAVITEKARAETAEAANATLVSDEATRAQDVEATMSATQAAYVTSNDAALAQESSDRAADIASNRSASEAEQLAARQTQMSAISDIINIKEAASDAADAALGVRIDNLLANTDPTALDSLTEIITAYTAADSSLSQLAIDNLAVFTTWVGDSDFATGSTFTFQADDIRSRLLDLETFAANLQSS
jgi:hypothetical protein